MAGGWLLRQHHVVCMVVTFMMGILAVAMAVTSEKVAEMEATTTECLIRQYTYDVSKPYQTPDGKILHCEGQVTVDTCWGRCDSSEIADYKVPFKISIHPVCTYRGKRSRTVNLTNCDPRHPDPTVEVFDATRCECMKCSSDYTSCENING